MNPENGSANSHINQAINVLTLSRESVSENHDACHAFQEAAGVLNGKNFVAEKGDLSAMH